MILKRRLLRTGSLLLLLVMIIAIGLGSAGCISGLTPIGWSGGAVSSSILFVGSSEGRLVSVNTANEERMWSEPLKAQQSGGFFGCGPSYGTGCGGAAPGVAIYGTPALAGDLVYIGGYNGKVSAYTQSNLAIRWVYPREGYLEAVVGGIIVADGRLFFGNSDGNVYALDEATGDLLWTFTTGDQVWGTPAVSGDTLYIGSFDKKMYALNVADGSEIWSYETEGSIICTPLVEDGAVYFGSFDRHFYALSALDGSLKWRFAGQNWFWAKPLLYQNSVYAGCLDDKVYVIKADSGELSIEYNLGSPVSSAPVMYGSTVIFAARDGTIWEIDTTRNELRELAAVDAGIYGPLTIYEGIVYAHTQDLTLHRINAENGAVLRPISLEIPD